MPRAMVTTPMPPSQRERQRRALAPTEAALAAARARLLALTAQDATIDRAVERLSARIDPDILPDARAALAQAQTAVTAATAAEAALRERLATLRAAVIDAGDPWAPRNELERLLGVTTT